MEQTNLNGLRLSIAVGLVCRWRSLMATKRTQPSHRCPPKLTGNSHTDWVLWELSLTLSEIARNSDGVRPEPDEYFDPMHTRDGTTQDDATSSEVRR